jgi:cysteine synthase
MIPAACDSCVIDEVEHVTDEESIALARWLQREEGLLVGGSSGTVVAAALRVAARGCHGPVVVVLADS